MADNKKKVERKTEFETDAYGRPLEAKEVYKVEDESNN